MNEPFLEGWGVVGMAMTSTNHPMSRRTLFGASF